MPLSIGDPAPDFTGTDVTTGVSYTLSQFTGRVVLVAFSGPSWCGPCKFEAPVLHDLWADIAQQHCNPPPQFIMVGVEETQQSLKTAVAGFGITFPALFDANGAIANSYGVNAVPNLFVIGPDQKVCNILLGASPPASALYDEIKNALLACGACPQKSNGPDISRWAAVMTILFGVVQDGGGEGLTPGGRPIPIGPWGPLYALTPAKQNVLVSLAISELSKSMKDSGAAKEIEVAALRSAEASIKASLARASREAPLQGQPYSVIPAAK